MASIANVLAIMNKYSIDKLPTEVLNSTAAKVRKLRKKAGFSQVEFAKRSVVSLVSIVTRGAVRG